MQRNDSKFLKIAPPGKAKFKSQTYGKKNTHKLGNRVNFSLQICYLTD